MWLLPTFNRIDKLKAFLAAAIEHGTSTPGLVLTDEADYANHKAAYDSLEMPEGWKVRVTKARSMGEKTREVWPEVEGLNWIGLLNDDFICATMMWDSILISKLDGKNYVSANDNSPNAFMIPVTATVFSMPLIKAVGFPIYPPGMQHLFIDNLWRDLGRATGCWRGPIANCLVLHKHVIFGHAVPDETHNLVYNQRSWDHDQAIYNNFMKHDFQATVQKIRAFQDYLPGELYNPDRKKLSKSEAVTP
jgi:hypothetical protein